MSNEFYLGVEASVVPEQTLHQPETLSLAQNTI